MWIILFAGEIVSGSIVLLPGCFPQRLGLHREVTLADDLLAEHRAPVVADQPCFWLQGSVDVRLIGRV